jgi:predicted nuclease of predicted toxin-antitoxin system
MKFLADESVDLPVYYFLKEKGFAIEHITFIKPGIRDDRVLRLAFSKKYILITVDKDFGELAFRSKRPSHGIILYRLSGFSNKLKAQVVEEVLRKRISLEILR